MNDLTPDEKNTITNFTERCKEIKLGNFTLGESCHKCGKPVCEKISDYESYLECDVWCHCGDIMFKSTNSEETYPTNVTLDTTSLILDYPTGPNAAAIGDFKVTYNP